MDKVNMPYMFILDKEMESKLFFIPDKYDHRYVNRYLSIIQRRFFPNITSKSIDAEYESKN